jgi:hypothetical protein
MILENSLMEICIFGHLCLILLHNNLKNDKHLFTDFIP